jgi:anti-sigma factor RsiW
MGLKLIDRQSKKTDVMCELLPWYVNHTLDEAELSAMETHLRHCEECAEELPILRAVQGSVQNESVSALAPKPNSEQFLAGARRRNLWPRPSKKAWVAGALAASVAAVALVLNWMESGQSTATSSIYQTVTNDDSHATIDYVLLVSFDRQVDAVARDAALRALAPESIAGPDAAGKYRVVVRLPARSMAELEIFRESVEANSAISSAAVVAVELPVDPH